ncbi:MAG: DHHA1 domain-containing protein [Bacteroidetes bacterium]|nr:DHHA1 domain-containing protein [Bacteroidota bacterium]
MQKRWVTKPEGDRESVLKMSELLGIDRYLSELLVQRGITTFENAKTFFRPNLNQLHDPFLMKDMDRAISRIEDAIANGEKIIVYGDYDVDGTTAVALVFSFLKHFHEGVDYYIPDRYTEGYGISLKGIDYAAENNFKLIIALDCGIKAVEKVVYALEKGIDFIICDHHRPGAELPPASAVLDPKRADCTYPYKELSGCGIGFKLIQAIALRKNIPFDELHTYLDLVVISIAADIVDITGENRVLAYYGLKLINSSPRPGVEALLHYAGVHKKVDNNSPLIAENSPPVARDSRDDVMKGGKGYGNCYDKELTITDLVFTIGPRINAAGRIESGKNSVKLLISASLDDARSVAEQINNYNTERKNLDAIATHEAIDMISRNEKLRNAKSTVIYHPDWHKGVIGIVASRLTETFYRPTIVLTLSGGLITGSARSVKDFDIYEAVDACSGLLEHFGGHKYAAGLSLKPENLLAFQDKFEEVVTEKMKGVDFQPELDIDLVLPLSAVNSRFYNILKQFAPFGPGNMAPLFETEGVVNAGGSRLVGKNHIRLTVVHPEISGGPCSAIAFQQGDHFGLIDKGIPFDICFHLEENEWNGAVNLQLNVKDIRFPM